MSPTSSALPTHPTWPGAGRAIASTLEHARKSSNHATLCVTSLGGAWSKHLSDAQGRPVRLAHLLADILGQQRGVRIVLWSVITADQIPSDINALLTQYPRVHPTLHPGELSIYCNTSPSAEHPLPPFVCSHPPRDPGHYMIFTQDPLPPGTIEASNGFCPPYATRVGSGAIAPFHMRIRQIEPLLVSP